MKNLKDYMRKRGSPIEKIPALGFRKSMEIIYYSDLADIVIFFN